jgi:exopolysaccharide production protein ExoY
MPNQQHEIFGLSQMLDFLSLAASFAITTWIMTLLSRSDLFVWPRPTSSDVAGYPAQYVVLLILTLIAWGIVSVGVRNSRRRNLSRNEFAGLIRAGLLWMATAPLIIFLLKLQEVSREFVLSYVSLGTTLLLVGNCARVVMERLIRRSFGTHRSAVIIGNGNQAAWLRQYLLDNYCPEPYVLIHQIDPVDLKHFEPMAAPTNGRASSPHHLTEAFVAAADIGADAAGLLPRLFEQGTKAHIVPGIFDISIFRPALDSFGGIPIITLRSGALHGPEATIKRMFDFFIAALLLFLATPFVALIALLVKCFSPGPVFFRQERVGKGGRRIHIYKFRTMYTDAERRLQSDPELFQTYVSNNYKLPRGKDPRITPIGHVLRELSLDEIPQLINVLKGEMSLVGPRPVVPDEIGKYGDYAPLLLSVQPGLTGQWQVSGRSNIANYAHRVQLDMEYIRDQSLTHDLGILMRTVPVVLMREGAH